MPRPVRNAPAAEAALRALPGGARALDAVAATPGAWIVGGAVRDAVYGVLPGELDVVVEGDPSGLLAALGGEPIEAHERFGTASVLLPGGLRVDVVAARAESYAHPGALPDVRPAALQADLLRRDITVNAVALRPGEPELRAAPGALEDLAAGVARVLHPASFSDDATRLWRVARYAYRLGLGVEPGTAALAAAADPTTVSGPRHGNELRRTLLERDPVGALAATRALAPALFPPGFAPRPVEDALALLPAGEGRPGLVALARACGGVDAATLPAWLDALAFPGPERDVVAAGSRAAVLHPLRVAEGPVAIARAAAGVPVEIVALAGGDGARRWLTELRHVRLAIGGEDLVAAGIAPGPDLGARLQRAYEARLEGRALTAQEQLRVALG